MDERILQVLEKLNGNVEKLTITVNSFDLRLTKIEQDVELIKIQQKEHGLILSAMKESLEVAKSERSNLNFQIAKLSGQVVTVKKRVTELSDGIHEVGHFLVSL